MFSFQYTSYTSIKWHRRKDLATVDVVLELRAHPAALAIGVARPRAEAGRPEGKVVLVREEPRRLRERKREERCNPTPLIELYCMVFMLVPSLSWQNLPL